MSQSLRSHAVELYFQFYHRTIRRRFLKDSHGPDNDIQCYKQQVAYLNISSFFTSASRAIERRAHAPISTWFLVAAAFWIVASASFSGFVSKWGLRDGYHRMGVEAMLDGTAHKPFAYRVLVPGVANMLESTLSADIKQSIAQTAPEKTFARLTVINKPEYRFRYIVIYYTSFFALFACLFVMRAILAELGFARLTSLSIPAFFVLSFPYWQTVGGYFYDCTELFFTGAAFLAALRGRFVLLIVIASIATLNKETFFFFLPTLYPILRTRLAAKPALLVTVIATVVSVAINALLKTAMIDVPGGAAEFHLLGNIKAYLSPWTYRLFEPSYGVIGPKGAFLGTILVVAIIAVRGWPSCSKNVQRHLLAAALLNLPLFIFFCAPGELRNLSLTFVGLTILTAAAVEASRTPPAR